MLVDSQLRKIISECVKQILNEKKNILKIGEKPDPLHHLQGSKKVKTTTSKEKNNKKKDDCGCGCNGKKDCDDDKKKVQKQSKVFHEKSDEFQHESLDDFDFDDFNGKTKKDSKKSKNENSKKWINTFLFEEEMADMPNINDLDLNIDDDFKMNPNNKY